MKPIPYDKTMEPKFACRVCGCMALDCPQLRDEVWALIAEKSDFLCLDHAEELLGRQITADDLAPCPANEFAIRAHQRTTLRAISSRVSAIASRKPAATHVLSP